MSRFNGAVAAVVGSVVVCACQQQATVAAHPSAPPPAAAPATAAQASSLSAAAAATMNAVNAANWSEAPAKPASAGALDPVLLRAEVLLDRGRFSPGVIDGQAGQNLRGAIGAWRSAHGLSAGGELSGDMWTALTADKEPALGTYVILPADVAGPFIGAVPKGFEAMSKLETLGYTSPQQVIADRFHMSEALLQKLNPGVDFTRPGTMLIVANPGIKDLSARIARIEVDKGKAQLRAYDEGDHLLAVYPATVGSDERPSPTGEFKVLGVARNPTYHYDPARLSFGHIGRKLSIAPGPNNPVGLVWIALSLPTYGIHGSPDPEVVGKTASHGCVRLTNWDAQELAASVRPGVRVVFTT